MRKPHSRSCGESHQRGCVGGFRYVFYDRAVYRKRCLYPADLAHGEHRVVADDLLESAKLNSRDAVKSQNYVKYPLPFMRLGPLCVAVGESDRSPNVATS